MQRALNQLPAILLTGGSGFLGRNLLAELADKYRFFVIARRTQAEARAPVHPNITWLQADLAERWDLAQCFDLIEAQGGVDVVLHFAAYYDFTGEENPEYQRTNVDGLSNVLALCRKLAPKRFVFSSSLAACELPREGACLTEANAPDGRHVYAQSKAQGEDLVRAAQRFFPTCIVRLGCLFSDFCEYPPLFVFLATWLSRSWKATVLGGQGQSAIPYIHIRDGVAFFRQLLERLDVLGPAQVLIASTNRPVSHLELFERATGYWYGRAREPFFMPKYLAWAGLYAMDLMGTLLGERPFERPWMGAYIDTVMTTDAHRTYELLGWKPNPRLSILRRLPILLENFRVDPLQWNERNMAAMKTAKVATHLRIFHLLEAHEEELVKRCGDAVVAHAEGGRLRSYWCLDRDELDWCSRATMLGLKNSIRTRDHGVFRAYCRSVAERRHDQGFVCRDVTDILRLKRDITLEVLSNDPQAQPIFEEIERRVRVSFALGLDEVIDVFEALSGTMIEDVGTGETQMPSGEAQGNESGGGIDPGPPGP